MLSAARHLIGAAVVCALSYAVYDPARICVYGLAFRTMKRNHPDMFDPVVARREVNLAIAELHALEQHEQLLLAA